MFEGNYTIACIDGAGVGDGDGWEMNLRCSKYGPPSLAPK